jgi:hypothetical protein
MIRIPELAHPTVADTPQRGAARRPPVCGKYRLPHDEYVHLTIGLSR